MKRTAQSALAATQRGVIVTGGSSGIGLAIAAALLQRPERPYKVFVTGQRPLSQSALAPLMSKYGNDDLCYSSGDTGDEVVVDRQLREATEFFKGAPIAGLFVNAGIGGGRYALENFSVERFDQMLHTNVRGVFLWLRAALPVLKAGSELSQIVVTSSVMGSRPVAQAAPYCATKFAVNGLVLSLRAELKASGHAHVKCGLVCPAGVATPWWEDPARCFRADDTPPPDTSKFLTPEAVANACISMLEQDASANVESVIMDAAG